MASTKAGGTAKNLTDSNPQYLGTKLYEGETAKEGSVIVRQRGTKIIAGNNVGMGKDHTLYALTAGKVTFSLKRKSNYDGSTQKRPVVSIIADNPNPIKKEKAPKKVKEPKIEKKTEVEVPKKSAKPAEGKKHPEAVAKKTKPAK